MCNRVSMVLKNSRQLAGDRELTDSLNRLASIVHQGAGLIDGENIDENTGIIQFRRALFHLCHAVGRPLCGQAVCPSATPGGDRLCPSVPRAAPS